jgi:outer membrane protein assembly factor BamB
MLRRVVTVLVMPLSALAVLAVAGCGTASPPAPAVGAARLAAPTASRSATSPAANASCPAGAWAYDITGAGTVAWRVTLPTPSSQSSSVGTQPVVVAGVAVFADGNVLVGIRVSDGRQLWQRTFPESNDFSPGTVYGLWAWDGSVIAQVGQVSPEGRVLSLNPLTGAVRWTLTVHRLLGTQAVTSNGVLAMLTTGGTLEAADLTTGKLLWSRPFGTSDGPIAAGTVVVATKGGVVAGFDARTGARLWSRGGMPSQPTVTVRAATQVLVADLDPYGLPQTRLYPVTGLSTTTGTTQWAVTTDSPVSAVWATANGIAVATAAASGHQQELLVVDPATGHLRWKVAVDVDPDTAPLITASDVVYAASHAGRSQIVDRAAATGKVRWTLTGSAQFIANPLGADFLVVAGLASAKTPAEVLAVSRATGAVKAKVALPASVSAAPVLAGGATLMQAATFPCGAAYAAHP